MISLENIRVSFLKENQTRIFGKERQMVLEDVSFRVEKGECMGILGESGAGKSTLGKVLCGLQKPDSGRVILNGQEQFNKEKQRKTGKKPSEQSCSNQQTLISVVFQDYLSSVNPRFRVSQIIGESLRTREKKEGIQLNHADKILEYLDIVGLDEAYKDRFPHELSGGQLQRVCIARAMAVNPQIILFDEAISSLDAHTQVQIMDLLQTIQKQFNLTYVFITHDLTAITYFCDVVLFLNGGKVVEECPIHEIAGVKHPYSKKLLYSILLEDVQTSERSA